MGIRMIKARLITNNQVILVNNATEEMRNRKLLKCYSEECNAKVTWARISKKNYEIEKKYYRLLNGEKHCETCSYNTLGQVEIIAKKADYNIIQNINKGQYEFRINIVYEALLSEYNKKIEDSSLNKDYNKEVNKGKKYKKSGITSPYLAVMRDIMKLRGQVEDNSELESIIKIKDKGHSIMWNNFYYDVGNEKRLYEYVEKKGYICKDKPKRLSYPVCIEGVVDEKIEWNENRISFINFKLSKFIVPDKNGYINIYRCSIITKNKEIVDCINDNITKNKKIKIVSYFIPSIKFTINNKYKNYNINGWINNEQQIYIESL